MHDAIDKAINQPREMIVCDFSVVTERGEKPVILRLPADLTHEELVAVMRGAGEWGERVIERRQQQGLVLARGSLPRVAG